MRKLLTFLIALAAVVGVTASSFGGSMMLLGVGKAGAAPSFTTFDPATASSALVLSNGNLTGTAGSSADQGARSIASHTSGKFFFSIVVNDSTSAIGIVDSSQSLTTGGFFLGDSVHSAGYFTSGNVWNQSTIHGTIGTFGAGNVVDAAWDIGAANIWFRVNGGNWNNSGTADPATNTGGIPVVITGPASFAAVELEGASTGVSAFTANFGATAYSFAAPSGFSNW
jgi:hypothetical protein